jgi:DNA-binding MarR family transcriptional regulator
MKLLSRTSLPGYRFSYHQGDHFTPPRIQTHPVQSLTRKPYMYIHVPVKENTSLQKQPASPRLPCACANLRRAARAVTRMYNSELRNCEIELTQYTLLMALEIANQITQGHLGRVLEMDSTTLTRTLSPLQKRGWISAKEGDDRRQKLLRLTTAGRRKLEHCRPDWERAQRKLRAQLGEPAWLQVGELLDHITRTSVH